MPPLNDLTKQNYAPRNTMLQLAPQGRWEEVAYDIKNPERRCMFFYQHAAFMQSAFQFLINAGYLKTSQLDNSIKVPFHNGTGDIRVDKFLYAWLEINDSDMSLAPLRSLEETNANLMLVTQTRNSIFVTCAAPWKFLCKKYPQLNNHCMNEVYGPIVGETPSNENTFSMLSGDSGE